MKKYNQQLFWVGFLLNIVRKFILILAAVVLGIVGIWINPVYGKIEMQKKGSKSA